MRPPPLAEAWAEVDMREFFDDAGGSFFFLGNVADLTSGAALTLEWVGVTERGTPRREVLGVAKWEAAFPLRAGVRERWVASGVVQALLGSLVGLRSEGMRQRVGGLVKSKNILPVFGVAVVSADKASEPMSLSGGGPASPPAPPPPAAVELLWTFLSATRRMGPMGR